MVSRSRGWVTSLAAPVRRKVTASAVTSSGVRHGTKLVGSQLGEGGLKANTQASLDAKSGYFVSNSNEVKRGQKSQGTWRAGLHNVGDELQGPVVGCSAAPSRRLGGCHWVVLVATQDKLPQVQPGFSLHVTATHRCLRSRPSSSVTSSFKGSIPRRETDAILIRT